MSQVLFVHGGGDEAFRFDQDIVNRLQAELGTDVQYTRLRGLEQIDWFAAFAELSDVFANLSRDATVVAHSIGGSATLKVLSDSTGFSIRNLFLLAPPYKGEDSHWGIDDFTFSNDFAERLDKDLKIAIYHSRDDDIIPFSDALLYQQKLPTAQVRPLDGYGHQFCGPLAVLASDIRTRAEDLPYGSRRDTRPE